MIFNLLEKKYHRSGSIALVDIDKDDPDNKKTVTVVAPAHKELAGVYKIWKYGDYGYVWARTYPNLNIINIIFFDDDGSSYYPDGPYRTRADRYIYIYRLDMSVDSLGMQQIARAETIIKNVHYEITKWYVQDQTTLLWNSTQNVNYQIS